MSNNIDDNNDNISNDKYDKIMKENNQLKEDFNTIKNELEDKVNDLMSKEDLLSDKIDEYQQLESKYESIRVERNNYLTSSNTFQKKLKDIQELENNKTNSNDEISKILKEESDISYKLIQIGKLLSIEDVKVSLDEKNELKKKNLELDQQVDTWV